MGFFFIGITFPLKWASHVQSIRGLSILFFHIAVHRYVADDASEAFAAFNVRNSYSFGKNYFIAGGITDQGPLEVFCIISGIQDFICPLTTPVYIFAKQCHSHEGRVPALASDYIRLKRTGAAEAASRCVGDVFRNCKFD